MAEPEEIAREESVAAEPAAASPRQPEPSTRPVSRPSRFERYVRRVISGSILADAEVQKHYPYVLFMAVLMFLYIANGFHIQKLHRRHDRLTEQVKELRARSLTVSSLRMICSATWVSRSESMETTRSAVSFRNACISANSG